MFPFQDTEMLDSKLLQQAGAWSSQGQNSDTGFAQPLLKHCPPQHPQYLQESFQQKTHYVVLTVLA